MPEGPEAEIARRAVAGVIGRRFRAVRADPRRADPDLGALVGARVLDVRRHGKWVLIDTTARTLGIHFGMTGRVVVDGVAPIERLEYGSGRDEAAWDRLVVAFDRGGLRVNDPRRWSRFVLDPDPSGWGPDVFEITAEEFEDRLVGGRPIKTVLLDQSRIAGLGNLCVDEILFHASIPPEVPTASLTEVERRRLVETVRTALPALLGRGGSHTGTLSPAYRAALPRCPRCGGQLVRSTVGGRTTVWCPQHQRSGHSG